ncbi:MAG: DUF4032 domain-containing protein [Kiritimatiellae bacterium]|nr:DUF4032 domain-containing protein [Kiritimatiellia bacterium]MDW8457600.1 DUF4032 domain-containing protein [Verrucomicrobiota bacterium]
MGNHRPTHDEDEARRFEEWAKNTALFRHWRDLKEDILRHKWFESERAGRDVGWDRAFVDYNLKIRRKKKP